MYQNYYASWRLYFFMGLSTILQMAVELGQVGVIYSIIQKGIDQSIKDANGRTALDCARMFKKDEVVEFIEKFSVNAIGHRDSSQDQRTPCLWTYYSITALFCEYGLGDCECCLSEKPVKQHL